MAKKNEVAAQTEGLFGMLGPVIKRAVEEESGRVLAELEGLIASRIRDQLVLTLQERLGGKVSNQVVARPPMQKVATRTRTPTRTSANATPAGKLCNVRGCQRPHRSVGYCSSHYQSSRKYGWPTPCPPGFDPPVRPRGRPPKAKSAMGGGAFLKTAADVD